MPSATRQSGPCAGPDGIRCPHCDSPRITRPGRDESRPGRQRYECTAWRRRFDALTGTIIAGPHQPLRVWVVFFSFVGLNVSKEPIAKELDLNRDAAQGMAWPLGEGVVERKPEVTLSGEVECNEVDVVAGPKGHPEAVRKTGEPVAVAD